jgi:hypothetical protein
MVVEVLLQITVSGVLTLILGVGFTQITIVESMEEQDVAGVPSSLKILGLKK